MMRSLCGRAACALVLFVRLCSAQATPPAPGTTAGPAPGDVAPTPPPAAWTVGGVNVSGYVDTYYNLNFNHPLSDLTQVQNFTVTANRMSLNSATLTLSRDPGPVGFRIDAGLGRTYDVFHLTEPSRADWSKHLLNAYVAFKPASWKGVQIDFGKFVTAAGAEVTESHLNWNYTRSLLFTNGPFYHVGFRATLPVNKEFTAGAQLVNGWNNLRDNNDGKTLGLTGLYTKGKVTWANVYYTGPENTDTNRGWRNFYDTALIVNANDKTSMYVNFDYGRNKAPDGPAAEFLGIAGAMRYALTNRFAIAPRIEWYRDADGFITGRQQTLREFTMTGEAKLHSNVIARAEFRTDWSNQAIFERGAVPFAYKRQNTLVFAMMFLAKPWE